MSARQSSQAGRRRPSHLRFAIAPVMLGSGESLFEGTFMRRRSIADHFKTAGQVVAVILLVAYLVLLLHKGSIDFSALATAHPGAEFWPAVGRHLIRMLGGG